jgi:hypothetical protein
MIKTVVAILAIAMQAINGSSVSVVAAEGAATADAVVHTVMVNISARNLSVPDSEYLAAMRAAGLENAEIPTLGSEASLIRGIISNATPGKLAALQRTADSFVGAHNGALVNIVFVGAAAECAAIEAQARERAIAALLRDARQKAQQAALTLGAPSGIEESGGCPVPGPIGGASVIDANTLKMEVTVKENADFTPSAHANEQVSVHGVGAGDAVVHNVKLRMFVSRLAATDDEILAAMRSAGVGGGTLGLPTFANGQPAPVTSATTIMRGSIDDATPDRLRTVRVALDAFVNAHQGTVTNVIFYGSSAECPAIEARARAIALSDARRRAASTGAVLFHRTALSGPLGVSETGGCPTSGDLGGAVSVSPVTMKMRITITENVTFDVLPSEAKGS